MMDQNQLMRAVIAYLRGRYPVIYDTDYYVMAEGQLPVLLVAHLDTVFKTPPHDIYYDKTKNVMWSPQGLGADDRAGVFAILQLIDAGLRPSVLFTTGEEQMGVGANVLIRDYPKCPYREIEYIIELDRQGEKDSVYYGCDNKRFERFINSKGFVTDEGTFSDISIIAPAWKIAAVNLSVGYLNEHCHIETLNWLWLSQTINKIYNLLKWEAANLNRRVDKFEYIQRKMENFVGPEDVCLYCGQKIRPGTGRRIHDKDTWGEFEYSLCNSCYEDLTCD